MQVEFRDGTSTEKVEVEFPLGHRRRRPEAIPRLEKKLVDNLGTRYLPYYRDLLAEICRDQEVLERMPVHEFMALFARMDAMKPRSRADGD